jgi:hypothetical protein
LFGWSFISHLSANFIVEFLQAKRQQTSPMIASRRRAQGLRFGSGRIQSTCGNWPLDRSIVARRGSQG